MKKIIPTLSQKQLSKALRLFQPQVYNAGAKIFYEGQIPPVAYILLDGSISLLKKKKIIHTLTPNQIIGVKELLNEVPFKFTVQIEPASKVLIIYKNKLESFLRNIRFTI